MLGGGGALLVLGFGAFALLRRRDRKEDAREAAMVTGTGQSVPVDTSKAAVAQSDVVTPFGMTPIITPEPEDRPSPAMAAPVTAPAASPSMTAASSDGRFDALEVMVAAPPSPENPFVSRRKRLRRAEFLLRTGHAPEGLASAASAPVPDRAAASTPERSREQVYNFGGSIPYRPKGWKPATT